MTPAEKKVFILLGAPGVGKGTQAQWISQQYHLLHIDTGHCLRSEIASSSELGQIAKGYVDRGELVPFELVMQVIKASMLRIATDQPGYLFDGFPRNLDQAQGLNQLLSELTLRVNSVLYLETPYDILFDRLAFRVTCSKCDTKFNLKLKPPKQESICDICAGALVTRKDDHPDVIGNRLKAYETETAPLVTYYEGHGLLTRIDADQPIDVVSQAIHQEMGRFFSPLDSNDKLPV